MSVTGIGRGGGRERRLAAARRAFGTLPPSQRRVLALRYVSGLSPDEIAAREGIPAADVDSLLATGRSELLRAPRLPYTRPVAAVAAAAALALVALPHAPTFVHVPGSGGPAPAAAVPVVGGDALVVGDLPTVTAPAAAAAAGGTVAGARAGAPETTPRDLDGRTPRSPGRVCRTLCVPQPRGHTLTVTVPEPFREPVGQKEVVLEQDYVPLCDAFPAPPAGGASCVPAST